RRIEGQRARVLLIEGSPRLLTEYPERLSESARRALQHLGVEVRTGELVSALDEEEVSFGQEKIKAKTVLWAAGVTASPLARSLGVPLDKAGRVHVTPRLTLPDHEEIFVVGDLAALEQDGKPIPGLAPVAMAEGKHAGHNVLRALRGEALEPFRYWD